MKLDDRAATTPNLAPKNPLRGTRSAPRWIGSSMDSISGTGKTRSPGNLSICNSQTVSRLKIGAWSWKPHTFAIAAISGRTLNTAALTLAANTGRDKCTGLQIAQTPSPDGTVKIMTGRLLKNPIKNVKTMTTFGGQETRNARPSGADTSRSA